MVNVRRKTRAKLILLLTDALVLRKIPGHLGIPTESASRARLTGPVT